MIQQYIDVLSHLYNNVIYEQFEYSKFNDGHFVYWCLQIDEAYSSYQSFYTLTSILPVTC